MDIRVRNENEIWEGDRLVFMAKRKIYRFKEFDANKIVIKIEAGDSNLFCISRDGQSLWVAESVSLNEYTPYMGFDIDDNFIYGGTEVGGMSIVAKIDPNTGKILEKKISKG